MSALGRDEVNARLAAIVATSNDAIISKNLDGIIQSWNEAATRIFGYEAHEMIGKPLLVLIPPDRKGEETEILTKIRNRQRIEHYQTVRIRKDGKPIEVSVTVSPILDPSGKVIGASKIARDITRHKRAERERERLYDMLRRMATIRDLRSLLQEITNTATEVSGAAFAASFYNVDDDHGGTSLLHTVAGLDSGTSWQPHPPSVLHEIFADRRGVRIDDVSLDRRFAEGAWMPVAPDGGSPVRSYLAMPVVTPEGKVLGGLFFGHTSPGMFDEQSEAVVSAIAGNASIALENARLQREVVDTAFRFQQLANTMPQLAWMARPDGSLYWANERWHEYTGIAAVQPLEPAWTSVIEPSEVERVKQTWSSAVRNGERWEDTFAIRRHDGVYRWHLSRAMPQRDEHGNITSWFGTNTDVTEQRELMREREELLVAERAARADAEHVGRMKDEFLATLSHELRTPLNAILGWSHIMRRGSGDPASMSEGLAVIERNARAQSQLIEDLLDMSRIVSGKLRLDAQPVDLGTCVLRAADVLRPMLDAKQIALQMSIDPSAGPMNGDPGRLQQIIWNLLSNAAKFTPRGGRVEVSVRRADSRLELKVSDNGIGIEPHFLPHVFERFRQSDSSSTRQHSGLGLGLAIVRQLVELHGGTIEVRSDGVGKGATFIVFFPIPAALRVEYAAHPHANTTPREGMESPVSLEGIQVLVVDDERDSRDLISRLLADHGASVVTAADADGALAKLKEQPPDLILSDVGMPQKDGYQFIREVRSLPANKGGRTTAIALTAFARSEDRTRAMLAGYQFHMPKPIEPQELIATVARLAERK